MVELLNFVFRDFKTFCGVVFLILVTGYAVMIALSGLSGFHISDSHESKNEKNKEE